MKEDWVVVCVKAGLATECRLFGKRSEALSWLESVGAEHSNLDDCWFGHEPLHYYYLRRAINGHR
jgi:hypothetical protein